MLANRPGGKIETHVPGFDLITGGGLIRSSAILLIGDSDGRKELLARQVSWNLLQEGAKVLYYTVDQSAEDLRYDMASYGWDVKPFEDTGKFQLVDIFSDAAGKMTNTVARETEFDSSLVQKGFYDLNVVYKEGIRFLPPTSPLHETKLAVFDSLSPLLSSKQEETIQLLHVLKFATRITKATGIGIVQSGVHDKRIEDTLKSIADGIVNLTLIGGPLSTTSIIEIVKYSGEYRRGPFPVELDEKGLRIVPIVLPNLAQVFGSARLDHAESN